jgi:glycosyltransferase involved in cell wall biosynthesis
VTERHTHLLRQLYPGLRAEKFVTIPNGYDEAPWNNVSRRDLRASETSGQEFVITYAGSIDEERTPEPIFQAVRRLIDAGELDIERLRFDFIGWCETVKGRPLEAVAAWYGLNGRVHVEDALIKTETFRRLAQSALLLLLAEGLTLQVPSKAYEYLRAGRPVLALAPREGAVADLFATAGGAWVVEPSDGPGIGAALREAYLGWSKGRDARLPDPRVVSRFDRAGLAGELAAVLDTAVAAEMSCG